MGHYWQNSRKWQNRKNQICRSAMSSCSRLKKSSENSNIFAWHINVARFACNIVKWDLYEWFSNIWVLRQWYNVTNMTLLHTSKRWHCVRRWFLVWLIYQMTKYEHSSAVAHVDAQTEERSTTSLSSAEREAAKYTCSQLWWGQAECWYCMQYPSFSPFAARSRYSCWVSVCSMPFEPAQSSASLECLP